VVLHEIRDFFPDGHLAFTRAPDLKVKPVPGKNVFARGVKALGIRAKRPKVPLKGLNLSTLLSHLARSNKLAVVSFVKDHHEAIFFGLITHVHNGEFHGRLFQTNGKFSRGEEVIPLDSIRAIQWGSRYEQVMQKLAKI
jgi:hypothetical protein